MCIIMILSGLSNVEDLDLTGQEDPILLRAAINTLLVHAAYKEGMMYIREEQDIPLDTRGEELYCYWYIRP